MKAPVPQSLGDNPGSILFASQKVPVELRGGDPETAISMTLAHNSFSFPASLSPAPSVMFLRSTSQIICLHPSPCFWPCL